MEVLTYQSKFPTVMVMSYPRSGNSMFRQVIEEVYGLPTYTIYDEVGADGCPEVQTLNQKVTGKSILFLKTHRLGYTENVHVIHVVRDGRDALLSWAKIRSFALGRRSWYELLVELINARPGLLWSDMVTAFSGRAHAVVRYEDMLEDHIGTVDRALDAIGVRQYMPDRIANGVQPFDDLHKEYKHFYDHGKAGQWQREFPPELLGLFWQKHGTAMEALGYRECLQETVA